MLKCINKQLTQEASLGNINKVKDLVENQNADVTSYLSEAVRLACEQGHLEIVKYLIKKGADINTDGGYALKWASLKARVEVVRYLLSIDTELQNKTVIQTLNGYISVCRSSVLRQKYMQIKGLLNEYVKGYQNDVNTKF